MENFLCIPVCPGHTGTQVFSECSASKGRWDSEKGQKNPRILVIRGITFSLGLGLKGLRIYYLCISYGYSIAQRERKCLYNV